MDSPIQGPSGSDVNANSVCPSSDADPSAATAPLEGLEKRPLRPCPYGKLLLQKMSVDWKTASRAMKLSCRKPGVLIASVLVAFLAALCWGGNIAAVYPIFEVTMRGESLHDWADDRIERSEEQIAELKVRQAWLSTQSPEGAFAKAKHKMELGQVADQLEAEQERLQWTNRLRPYIVKYLPADPFKTIVMVVVFITIATLIKSACHITHQYFACRLTQGVTFDLRQQFFEAVLKSDSEINLNRGASQLWTRFSREIPHVSQGLTGLFGRTIGEPLKIAACLAGAAIINWRLLLVSLTIAPFAAWAIAALARKMKKQVASESDQAAAINQQLFEIILGLPIVQAYTMEPVERVRFRQASMECWTKSSRAIMFRALAKPAVEVLGLAVVCSAMLTGAHLVLNQETTVFGLKIAERTPDFAGLMVFIGMLVGAYDPMRKLGETMPQLMLGLAAAERVFNVIDTVPNVDEPANPIPLPTPHTHLTMEAVEFRYRANKPVLHPLDLEVRRGETLAIVGPNGCGKSTLAGLIPRFYDAVRGSVKIDGIDIRDASLVDLRKRIGVVTQNPHLFDDSVLNNIRYGKPEATMEEVVAAAMQAHAHEFIERDLADGYNTMVGQGGRRLSGGQRQRIAFARAILRDPEILILDEPTSQIDLESEKLILDTLKGLIHNRTVILITHRLALLELADRTLVMNRGRILQRGSHDELMKSSPQYRQLQRTGQLGVPGKKAA
ncbi:MAG: ABC transporter ATP-binding protein [Planctomycetaceae bacterium]